MQNTTTRFLLALTFAAVLARPGAVHAATAHQPANTTDKAANINPRAIAKRHAAPLVESGIVPGLVVGILHEGEKTYVGVGRLSDDDPSRPGARTIFEIGSISKTFTATLLAGAVVRGGLNLDDPITGLLPEGIDPPRWDGTAPTLGQLADHTSGLGRLPRNIAPNDQGDPYADYGRDDL